MEGTLPGLLQEWVSQVVSEVHKLRKEKKNFSALCIGEGSENRPFQI
jgi:hypothetical protein